jgi:uncharacterized membrane protein
MLAVLAASALVQISTQAHAAFTVCNNTGSKINVAIAYGPKDAPGTNTGGHLGVTAEGWWSLDPRECAQLSSIHAGNNWLYYHATSRNGTSGGSSLLCVSNKPFTIGQSFRRSGDKCPPNQHLAGFKRLETSKTNYKLTIN